MHMDYSPLDTPRRRTIGRSTLLLSLLLAVITAFVARDGWSSRSAPVAEPVAATPAAFAESEFPSDSDNASAPESIQVPTAREWQTHTVKSGQTLSTIFGQEGLPAEDWVAVLKLGGDALRLKRLRAGETLRLRKNGDRLTELNYTLDEQHTLNIRRNGDALEAVTLEAAIERRPTFAAGVIDSSLFASGLSAGLSHGVIMEMADIFGYDVDFALDIRRGDRFTVIYEQLFKDGQKLRDSGILAAEFVNQGQAYRAMRFSHPDGTTAFYTADGASLRKAFLRTPLDFARISSSFSLARRHPILNKIRAHKGVDYAAGLGTPVKAAGDGRVTFMGVKGGYGKVIVLKHGGSVETLYAHLSRYRPGLGGGSRVSQGQIIGYVGKTGLATAPHLHYEFRVGGVHKNPVTVPLPRGNPLPRNLLTAFRISTAPLLAQLDSLGRTQFAQASATVPASATSGSR